ncbi:MAG: cyclic nucleotide-binding domain-containing protein [Magnetococcales bacterium]|nr:cyclic nucleotide-binding domain-containing protein [Magnetococcales bacterium]
MELKPLLDKIPFFAQFTDGEKERILRMNCYFAKYKAGDFIIREGSLDNNSMYIILKGGAHVTQNPFPDTPIATLEAGTVVGEISFLTLQPRISNVVAREPTVCFTINGATMEDLPSPLQHKIKDRLIEILVKRLETMNQTLVDLMRR